MALTAQALAAEIDAETNRLADVLAGLTSRLNDALAQNDPEALKAAISAELSNVVEPAVDRLRGVGVDPSNPVPDPTPEPPADPTDEFPIDEDGEEGDSVLDETRSADEL